jgi:hypothetical protein
MALKDVYTGGQTYAGAFKAGDLTLTIGGTPINGAMVQNISYQFNQQINQFFELGSSSVFFVAGRAQGNLTINKLAAAKGLALNIDKFNDVCNPTDLQFSSKSSGCGAGGGTLGGTYNALFKSCVLAGVSGQADAQSVVITHGITLQFVNMQIEDF